MRLKIVFLVFCVFALNIYASSSNTYIDGNNSSYDDNNNTSSEIKLYEGWNLISMQENNFTKYGDYITSIWGYKDNKWHAYSNIDIFYSKIVNYGIPQLQETNSNDGVWILSQKDANITVKNQSVKNYNIYNGWNLLGSNKNIKTSIFNNSCVSYLWQYDTINKQWKLYRSDEVEKYFGYDKFKQIEANSGFWAYGKGECDITIDSVESNTSSNNSSQSNKITKLGSFDVYGDARSVVFSSDGTKAYVATGIGLIILDTTNPSNITKLGSFYTDGWVESVTLSSDGTKAYVANENGLVVLDISLLDD